MIGRVLGGIATSILYSAFESWLNCEHRKVRPGWHLLFHSTWMHLCTCYDFLIIYQNSDTNIITFHTTVACVVTSYIVVLRHQVLLWYHCDIYLVLILGHMLHLHPIILWHVALWHLRSLWHPFPTTLTLGIIVTFTYQYDIHRHGDIHTIMTWDIIVTSTTIATFASLVKPIIAPDIIVTYIALLYLT